VADDLHALLSRAGCKPPYVLVGYSLGALYVRGFAMRFPREVGGLVLIDGTPERYLLDMRQVDPKGAEHEFKRLATSDAAGFSAETGPPGVRGEWGGLYRILLSGSLGVPGSLPDVPTVVITGARPDGSGPFAAKLARMKTEEQGALLQAMTDGRHVVTVKSGHEVMGSEPGLITDAIKWTVAEARKPE
jgi:pimeloyl-ACP methyl ester carboxylesterase